MEWALLATVVAILVWVYTGWSAAPLLARVTRQWALVLWCRVVTLSRRDTEPAGEPDAEDPDTTDDMSSIADGALLVESRPQNYVALERRPAPEDPPPVMPSLDALPPVVSPQPSALELRRAWVARQLAAGHEQATVANQCVTVWGCTRRTAERDIAKAQAAARAKGVPR